MVIITNEKMNFSLIENLRLRGDNISLYAIARIEELEYKLNNLLKPDVSGSLQCTDKEYKEVMTAIYPKDRSKKFYRK